MLALAGTQYSMHSYYYIFFSLNEVVAYKLEYSISLWWSLKTCDTDVLINNLYGFFRLGHGAKFSVLIDTPVRLIKGKKQPQ